MSKNNFNEIIDSVSVDDVTKPAEEDSAQTSIALFARFMVKAHVNWDNFPENLKDKFYTEVENLYDNPPQKPEELLKKLDTILIRCVPDNHSFVLNDKKQRLLSAETAKQIPDKAIDKYTETHVGKNTVFTLEEDSSYKQLCLQKKGTEAIGIFEKMTDDHKKVGIISLSKCPQPSDPAYDLASFQKIFNDNYQNWDAVVLDVRGNEGGNAQIISNLSRVLYGNEVVFCGKQSLRMSPEAKFLHHEKYPDKKDFLKMLQNSPKEPYLAMPEKSETEFNKEKGFDKNIYILTDRRTSSSAEYVCGLYKHPKVKFLGENTCGCGEFGDTVPIKLPCGGELVMGVWKNTINCGIPEGQGREPTHPTQQGRDAFQHCLDILHNDFSINALRDRLGMRKKPDKAAPEKPLTKSAISNAVSALQARSHTH